MAWSLLDDPTIALVVNLNFILGDHVAEDKVSRLIILGFHLQILAPLHQGVNLGQFCIDSLLLEALFFLFIKDLLAGPPPDKHTQRLV